MGEAPIPRTFWPLQVVRLLVRVNTGIALLCGLALLATVGLVLAEIVLRQLAGRGLGGSDEIAGYVMAGVAAWGFSYALVERAHVRIDVLTGRLPPAGRSAFDFLALLSLLAVSAIVTWYAWIVLSRSFLRSSRANTPLETPLWIPQSVWFGGWAWLTLVTACLVLCLVALILRRQFAEVQAVAGASTEGMEEPS
jgi:TRAP-type C4-dicarboxylate transport system permease small subunit